MQKMQAISRFCIFLWPPEAEQLIQVINSGDSVFVLMVKWSPTALLSTWDSWGSHLASLTSTYNLLQLSSRKVESSFSRGDLSHSRWQGRSSPENFSLSLSCLLSPFLSVLFSTSLCPLLQGFVWPNSALVKNLSFRRVSTWFIWRLLCGWPVYEGLYSYKSPAFSYFLVLTLFMLFSCLFIKLTVTCAEKVLWVCVQSSAGMRLLCQRPSMLMQKDFRFWPASSSLCAEFVRRCVIPPHLVGNNAVTLWQQCETLKQNWFHLHSHTHILTSMSLCKKSIQHARTKIHVVSQSFQDSLK